MRSLTPPPSSPDIDSSILDPDPAPRPALPEAPECFADLRLDTIFARVTSSVWSEYGLERFYHDAPTDLRVVAFRQAVMRETERADLQPALLRFAERMRAVRRELDSQARSAHPLEAARFFLRAAQAYVDAVSALHGVLSLAELTSEGLRRWRDALARCVGSTGFAALAADCATTADGLARVSYHVRIDGLRVTVMPADDSPDYAAEVEHLFARFRGERMQGAAPQSAHAGHLDPVEAQILTLVARLHPAPFGALVAFCAAHAEFQDARVTRFDAELPYYLAFSEALAPLRRAGMTFAYPAVSATDKTLDLRGAFDLALAWELHALSRPIVDADVSLRDAERLMVVSGPNSGGKTTFARMIGQVHYLARLGFPVPGRSARCPVSDRILTHFERLDDLREGRGKLQDDLLRMHRILDRATPASLVILNEIFASTTVVDALYLARRILAELSARDLLAVCVTFLEELSTFDEKTVSFVAGVDRADPTIRTYRIERRPADGRAHALAIAAKRRVTREWLLRRLDA